jgi:hypothetical protein
MPVIEDGPEGGHGGYWDTLLAQGPPDEDAPPDPPDDAPEDSSGRMLTPEEAQRAQRWISEGMKPEIARAKMLGANG